MYKYTKQQQQQSSYKLYVHMQKLPSSGGYDVSKHNAEQTYQESSAAFLMIARFTRYDYTRCFWGDGTWLGACFSSSAFSKERTLFVGVSGCKGPISPEA
ncbi:MAG: hypothetical protein FRX49_08027 [Trebouxia sp. A1-2]|nr:MAG: hypothetical protein FRX49_08027 [Trebouxia sp. A1-2]